LVLEIRHRLPRCSVELPPRPVLNSKELCQNGSSSDSREPCARPAPVRDWLRYTLGLHAMAIYARCHWGRATRQERGGELSTRQRAAHPGSLYRLFRSPPMGNTSVLMGQLSTLRRTRKISRGRAKASKYLPERTFMRISAPRLHLKWGLRRSAQIMSHQGRHRHYFYYLCHWKGCDGAASH
jgi:hypothetical protein